MDYEKLYKEALERASKYYNANTNKGYREIFEDIFHEFKESEDERIKKGLIKGLSAMRDIHKHQTFSDDAISIDDAIAWLEKQGEQKPALNEYDLAMIDNLVTDETCPLDSEYLSWLKSLKERVQPQPKQEWSEEDEDVINHLIAVCAGAKRYRQFAGCLQDDITKYQNWLKSLKDRMKGE